MQNINSFLFNESFKEMKKRLNYLIILVFQLGFSQNQNLDSSLINNWTNSWINFSKTCEKIDSDSESLLAYSSARDLIVESKKHKNIYEKIFLINKAKTLLFYGISYTKSMMYKSRNPNTTGNENLNRKILETIYPRQINFSNKNLIESELRVNQSMTNFYLVSNMNSYEKLKKLCANERLSLVSSDLDKYYLNALFSVRITNFKIYVTFISDIFYSIYENPTDVQISDYFTDITKIGRYLDNLSDDMNLEKEINNLIFNDTILINLLNESIKKL